MSTRKKAPVRRSPAKKTVARKRRVRKTTRGYKSKDDYYHEGRNVMDFESKRPMSVAAGTGLGGAAGSLFGPAGTAVGSFLGGKLGHMIGNITGFGDYQLNSNTIMTGGMSPPQVVNTINKGGIVIRHREYLTDINATVAFTSTTISLNPGLTASFPWLSQIAPAYEEYRWRGLLFEFKSLSSDAVLSSATSSALGSVMMSTQYNALLPPFVDKRTMDNYEFANSSKPSCTFIHPVECKASQTPLTMFYVRNGAITSGDLRLYDLGNFQIATQGMQAASGVAGELWATYEIEFFKPRFTIGVDQQADHFAFISPVAATAPMGNSQASTGAQAGSNLGGNISVSGIYFFNPNIGEGTYLLLYYFTGTTSSGGGLTWSPSFTNCTRTLSWSGANQFLSPPVGTNTTTVFYGTVVTLQSVGASFTVGAYTGPTVAQSGGLFVIQMPAALITLGKLMSSMKKTIGGDVMSRLDMTPQDDQTDSESEEEPNFLDSLPPSMKAKLLALLSDKGPGERKSV